MTNPHPKLTLLARERIARARENKATLFEPGVEQLQEFLRQRRVTGEWIPINRIPHGLAPLQRMVAQMTPQDVMKRTNEIFRADRMRELKATLKRKDRTPMPRRDLATIDPRLAKFCEALARDIGIPVDKLYRRSLYYSDRTVNRLRRQRYRRTHPLRTA